MKRNLILSIIACGASLALCPGLRAQEAAPAPSTTGTDAATGRGHHGGDMLAKLTTELTLTADQQAQIKPILEAAHTKMKANRDDASLTREDKMAKNKAIRDDMNTQINALLTPDQQTKYAALIAKMHSHRHESGESQPSASPAATP